MDNYLPDLSKIWPEWEAVEKLGEGSFGRVYKCVRNEYNINAVCAVKVVSIPQSESELNAVRAEYLNEESVKAHFKEIVDDFANEIKIMVDLKGAPNIVTIENYKIVEREDSIGWDIYIRMEYLTAFTDFSRKNTFTEKAVAKLALDICDALEICAGKNIIHRDIKPANIFIDSYGNYKIGDFGVARKLENASLAMSKKGTYTYMAPEVYKGNAYDNRADIYSLGMVMYHLLNRGKDPFTNPNAEMVVKSERENALVKRMNGHNLPAPIDASVEMSKIVIKACAFNPANRFATPSEFKRALTNFVANPPADSGRTVTTTAGSNDRSAGGSTYNSTGGNTFNTAGGGAYVSAGGSAHGSAGGNASSFSGPYPPHTFTSPHGPVQPPAPKKKKSKKGIVAVIITLLIVAAAGLGIYFFLQNGEILPKNDAEAIASIKEDYLNNKITFDKATDNLDEYLKSDDADTKKDAKAALEEMEAIKPDRDLHVEGKDCIDSGDYTSAIDLLQEIPSDYPQFDEVCELISSAKSSYKSQVLAEVDSYIANNDFDAARNWLNKLKKHVNDSEVNAAFDKVDKKELSYLYNNQKVYVIQGSEEFFYDTEDYSLRLNIKNQSDKTTELVVLSVFEYNSSGDPVTLTQYKGTYDNEMRANTDEAIAPYSILDMTNEAIHWSGTNTDATYAVACVDYVEFADGTRWDNPYHDLWLEEYNASYSSWQNKGY